MVNDLPSKPPAPAPVSASLSSLAVLVQLLHERLVLLLNLDERGEVRGGPALLPKLLLHVLQLLL